MSLEEQTEKCQKIHDILAEYWNWAYYNTSHSECSWLTLEYVKQLKPDIERRVPVIVQELEQLLELQRVDSFSILDVGCGVGGFIQRALSTLSGKYPNIEFKVTGIDMSSEMIDYASKNLHYLNVELVCDSITNRDLKFKNEPFDAAVMMVTLSFYNDDNAKDILCAIHDKLKRDGCIVLMDFAWTYKWQGAKLFSKPLQKVTDMFFSHLIGESFHFNTRTEDHLKVLLNEAGFETTKCYLSEKASMMRGMLVIDAKKQGPQIDLVVPKKESQTLVERAVM